jgi:hypothetical protein
MRMGTMKQTIRKASNSIIIGMAITAAGFVAAFFTAGSNLEHVFYWQGYLLQNLVSAPNIGSAQHPAYEATPIHVVAFLLGIQVGVVLYSLLSFAVLSIVGRKN